MREEEEDEGGSAGRRRRRRRRRLLLLLWRERLGAPLVDDGHRPLRRHRERVYRKSSSSLPSRPWPPIASCNVANGLSATSDAPPPPPPAPPASVPAAPVSPLRVSPMRCRCCGS